MYVYIVLRTMNSFRNVKLILARQGLFLMGYCGIPCLEGGQWRDQRSWEELSSGCVEGRSIL